MMITKLGKYLRKARVEMDINMAEMADAVEISPALLSAIETGRRDTKPEIVGRLADYLGLSGHDRTAFEYVAISSNSEVSIQLDQSNEKQTEAIALLARHIGDLNQEGYEEISKLIASQINKSG